MIILDLYRNRSKHVEHNHKYLSFIFTTFNRLVKQQRRSSDLLHLTRTTIKKHQRIPPNYKTVHSLQLWKLFRIISHDCCRLENGEKRGRCRPFRTPELVDVAPFSVTRSQLGVSVAISRLPIVYVFIFNTQPPFIEWKPFFVLSDSFFWLTDETGVDANLSQRR